MSDSLLNKQQRKKARRKARKQSERQAHRDLDAITGQAIAQAIRLAPTVLPDGGGEATVVVDVAIGSISEAQFVRKRVNDALQVGEWLDVVATSLWQAGEDVTEALSDYGAQHGFELRLHRRA